MSVITCDHYKVVFQKEHLDSLLRTIAGWGKFEPVSPSLPLFEKARTDEYSHTLQKIKLVYHDAIEYIESQTNTQKQHTQEGLEEALHTVFENFQDTELKLDTLVQKVEEVQEARQKRDSFQDRTKELRSLLNKIGTVTQPVFAKHTLFETNILSVPSQLAPQFEEYVKKDRSVIISLLHADKDEQYYICASPKKEEKDVINEIIQLFDAKEVSVDESLHAHSPHAIKQELEKRLHTLESRVHTLETETKSYFKKHETSFKFLVDLLEYEQQVTGLYRYVGYYTGTFSKEQAQKLEILKKGKKFELSGWLNPQDKASFMELISNMNLDISVEETDAHEKAEVRTVLKNHPFVKPFENITKLMGVPSASEIDPTPFFSPFFILFFGFALGDAGYGLIMLAITVYFLRKKIADSLRQGMIILFFCSISTIFFGAISGSWFGANLEQVPGTLGATLGSLKQFDLQGSLLFVLAASIGIGFVHQIVGLILQALVFIKNKEYLNAAAFPGTWILFLAALIVRIYVSMLQSPSHVVEAATLFLYVAFGAFIIGQGIKARPIFVIPLIGLAQLFYITGFLSNSLSYARLLALGLATGVIASVINFLAGLFGGTDSILGIITMIFILVLGHSINIGLNLLGTFINVLRLQLVEFFPRFFQAAGVELSPIKMASHYFTFSDKMIRSYWQNFPIIITNYRNKNL